VLEAAAISGPRIDPRRLEQVTAQTQESLDACVEAGLLTSERDQLTFRHELWREAVLDTVPAHRQVALHRVILAALVQADAPDDRLARFAHHAEEARDATAVLKYAPAAARYASQLGAHREAAAQYARALQWAHQLDARQRALLLRARSAECFLIDQAPEAIDARRAAIGIWHELSDRQNEGDDLCWLSRAYWLAGNNAECEHAIQRALQLLEYERPGLPLARALSTYAQLRFLSCDYEKAIAAWRSARSLLQAPRPSTTLPM
jgi:tetratricopeptide (TPR) repeat protein